VAPRPSQRVAGTPILAVGQVGAGQIICGR
jgi:hypothetical protein